MFLVFSIALSPEKIAEFTAHFEDCYGGVFVTALRLIL